MKLYLTTRDLVDDVPGRNRDSRWSDVNAH